GILKDRLMARVGPDAYQAALEHAHAHPMDFTGRPMKGYVEIAPEGLSEDQELQEWIRRCEAFVATLPPK
ncbi:MAG: TfoX/Sxy family protein, partial [Gammaproteobacteria bacterium]